MRVSESQSPTLRSPPRISAICSGVKITRMMSGSIAVVSIVGMAEFGSVVSVPAESIASCAIDAFEFFHSSGRNIEAPSKMTPRAARSSRTAANSVIA
jgi:hypothetical protein